LFLALALAAKGSVDASPALWCGALVMLAASAWGIPREARLPVTALGVVVAALALWMVGTNLFANTYNSAAQYHAAFLFGGYLYGRRAAPHAGMVLRTGLVFGVALAAWALWHLASGQRAQGPFLAPATLAAVLNLVLLPGLVLLAAGSRRPALVAVLGLLLIALAASTSRGGWLAFAGAGAVSFFFLRSSGTSIGRGVVAKLGGLFVLGLLAVWIWSRVMGSTAGEDWIGTRATASFQSRLELYAVVLPAIQPPAWLLGAGYDAFYYLLETARGSSVPVYMRTHFVHNDYLQTLHAFGIPGLATLLLLVVAPVVESWRRLPQLAEQDRRVAIAALAAMVSMALHALVDFPFFIPLCVLLYGVALGILDAMLLRASNAPSPALPTKPVPAWRRVLTAATATLAAWILVVPVVAEAATARAQSEWRKDGGERAAFWFEAARRIDARDWRYHWYAAQFWTAQTAAHGDPAAARLADLAFAAAISANGRDARPLRGRILLHTRLRKVLAAPADPETVREWANRALALAPTDAAIQAERDRVMRQFPSTERR
jgi:O-antigen ligase